MSVVQTNCFLFMYNDNVLSLRTMLKILKIKDQTFHYNF